MEENTMKINKNRIIIAAAVAAISMVAFTGCSGTYTVDEKTGAVNVTPAAVTNAEQAASAGDAEVKKESAAETISAVESKAEAENASKAENSAAPVQTSAPAKNDAPVKNDAPAQTTAPAKNDAPVQSQAETTTAVTNAQENSVSVNTAELYGYASTSVDVLNSLCYSASGLQIRWGHECCDANFEPCEETSDSFRFWKLRDYSTDYLQEIRNDLYGGYLSENVCSAYDLYRAENAIVEHEGQFYFDSFYMGTGNYDLFQCIEGSVNVIDDSTFTVDAMHKDGMNISGDGRKCVITMRKVSGTDSWQLDSIQDI
jgi:hypothetical protein